LSLLSKLLGDTPLQFKPKLVPKADDPNETEEVQVPFVKVGDTLQSLDSWLEQEHKDLLDALVVSEEAAGRRHQQTPGPKSHGHHAQADRRTGTQAVPRARTRSCWRWSTRSLSTHMSPGQLRKAETGK
jgi:hypothetical protein